MLDSKRALPSYPDGVLKVYTPKDRKTDFGARRNIERIDDMVFVCSLCFNVQTIREQDYEFAERASFKLSLKVKTPRFDLVKSDCLALVGSTLFDVSHIDATQREMYLYLEEVREIDLEGHSGEVDGD